ncbi:MAG: polyketide cyclase [Actinomycetota bacterium]|nr:polyketide cyclase [Actinomycetota bacterium]MDQ2956294.1 polyketide cyclase [Actinomycetota bacterium]
MIEQTETQIRVQQSVDVGAADLFAVLADPRRHVEIDGSGMLRADVSTELISGVGQVFTMAMHYPALGDYRTENHVLEFEPGRRISWATAREHQSPPGVRWSWDLEPEGAGRTSVLHSCDWSRVTDPAVLARVSFPRVSAEQLQQSVRRLAAAAAASG